MTWAKEIDEISDDINKECKKTQQYKVIKKFRGISGTLVYELSIVEDNHSVPEWNKVESHLNTRVKYKHPNGTTRKYMPNGTKITKRIIQLPSELTKHHYKPNELGKILSELFNDGKYFKFLKGKNEIEFK